jgi:hypothetical protein
VATKKLNHSAFILQFGDIDIQYMRSMHSNWKVTRSLRISATVWWAAGPACRRSLASIATCLVGLRRSFVRLCFFWGWNPQHSYMRVSKGIGTFCLTLMLPGVT